LFIKKNVSEIENSQIREFIFLGLAFVLIVVSKVHHVGETIVYRKSNKYSKNVIQIFKDKISEMTLDLKIVKKKINDPGNVIVKRGDVRNLENLLEDKSVDHIITHPPYANNYNYRLHDRLPLYFLDCFKSPEDEKI